MRIEDLVIFVDVVQYHSMNVASEKHFMTPQNLSKIIHNMEQELGVVLFKRSKRGSELTAVGEKFYWQVLKVIGEYDKALEALREKEEVPVAPVKVKVICNEGLINYAVLNAYDLLQEEGIQHVTLDLDLLDTFSPQEFVKNIKDRDYDIIAAGMLEKDLEMFIANCLGYMPIYTMQSEWVLLVSERHPLAGKVSIKTDEMKELKFLLCKENYGYTDLMASGIQGSITVNSLNIVIEQVERSNEFCTLACKNILSVYKMMKPRSTLIAIPVEPQMYTSFIVMIDEQSNQLKEVRNFGSMIAQALSMNE